MRCIACKKGQEETELFEGIREAEMVLICEPCASLEGVPLIRKPTEQQLQTVDTSPSVRERMERMSGMANPRTQISEEQLRVQGHLARLRMPGKKETHPHILDNYYRTLMSSRRRKKLSYTQLANMVNIDATILEDIEKGKIPENFEEIFLKLESFLGIKLLKERPSELLSGTKKEHYQQNILEHVRKKMEGTTQDAPPGEGKTTEELDIEAYEATQGVNQKEVNLNYLIERKRKREVLEQEHKKRIQTESLLGDDLELDE